MQRMFTPSVSGRKRHPNNPRNAGRNGDVSRPLGVKEPHGDPAQVERGEHVQLEHVPVHVYVDVLPQRALRATGVVDENVDGAEMADGRVEVALVQMELRDVHFYDEHVVFLEETAGRG